MHGFDEHGLMFCEHVDPVKFGSQMHLKPISLFMSIKHMPALLQNWDEQFLDEISQLLAEKIQDDYLQTKK